MSSLAVRDLVKDFLDDNSSEDYIDLTGHYEDLRALLNEEGIQPDAPWLGLDFIGNEEEPVSLSATNDQGLYREFGLIQLHVCAAARLGVGSELISRGEVLRNLFRGRRIGNIVVESVTPVNTGPGATLEFDAGYVSGTVSIAYYFDVTL
jgi:hypothetical protein